MYYIVYEIVYEYIYMYRNDFVRLMSILCTDSNIYFNVKGIIMVQSLINHEVDLTYNTLMKFQKVYELLEF